VLVGTAGKWVAVGLVASTLGAVALTSTSGEKHDVSAVAPAEARSVSVSRPQARPISSPDAALPEKTSPAAAISEPLPSEVPHAARPGPSTRAIAEETRRSSASKAGPLLPSTGDLGAVSSFDDELRLIKLAKSHLDSGQTHLAEAALDEHARSFSNGKFRDERDALRILALCQSGKRERGAELAQEYARHKAGSPMAQRLLRACIRESALPPLSGK
jgi:hypothetical protein